MAHEPSARHPARRIVDLAQARLPQADFDRHVIELLDEVIGFDFAFSLRSDAADSLIGRHAEEKVEELATLAAQQAFTRYAPCLSPVIEQTMATGVYLDSALGPRNARCSTASPYFVEVLEPAGIRSMVQLCARWRGEPVLRVSMYRCGRQRYGQQERDRLFELLPTLEAGVMAHRFAPSVGLGVDRLSPRERQVARQVARGFTNAQIACVLGSSPFTVRNQIARIFQKLEVDSRAELAVWATRALNPRDSLPPAD